MASEKIAITLEKDILEDIDSWIREGRFKNRSQAFQSLALKERARTHKYSFAEALKFMDDETAQEAVRLAEEWVESESEWPEY